jgi:AcrR family transcriptional regulator
MTRSYRQARRLDQVAQRRRQIIWAVGELMVRGSFDDVTLQGVADEAGVSLKTVTRQFGSKEQLLKAAMTEARQDEESQRAAPAQDPAQVAHVLAGRYEEMAEMIYRMGDAELRYSWLGEWGQMARESHLSWLEEAFAGWLPDSAADRHERLMCLFSATEIRSWWAIRHRFDCDSASAERIMRTQLEALTDSWERRDRTRQPKE